MNPSLLQDVTSRLNSEYEFRLRGDWLREGLCPSCGKKELYARAEAPWMLRCGRENKCAWNGHVKDLFPDLFNDWSKRYPVNESRPDAAATAYMTEGRGFDIGRVRGLYTQGAFHDGRTGHGSATVRFAVGNGHWERLIDQPQRFGGQKARFSPGLKYQGTWWAMPKRDLSKCAEVWITEGIFDAIALEHHGIDAVAALSCNNYPEKALDDLANVCRRKRPLLVFAFDGDAAGRRYMRQWVRRAREAGWPATAAMLPSKNGIKRDWNELHQRGDLDPGKIQPTIDEARHEGALLIATRPSETALLIYKRSERREFWFEHRRRLFWFSLDLSKYNKAAEQLAESSDLDEEQRREQALKESGAINEIANCFPQALYYQANKVTDESWYYFRIEFPHGAKAVKNAFTSGQMSSAAEFKKRLLGIGAGAVWTGSSQQLDKVIRDQTYAIKEVNTIDYIGYSREHGAWVFGDIAVRAGKVHTLNEEDYFDMGRTSIKSLSRSLALKCSASAEGYDNTWLQILHGVHRERGIIALAFWFGTLFAEHIRSRYKIFPFLEMTGDHGAGKTTLVKFLWKLLGRDDYEGFDPNKASHAGRTRNFVQVSALPIVLIEGDGDEDAKHKRFNWEDLKSVYNGNPIRALGVKTAGNETYEPPFRGAIVIEQNQPVNASSAILSRIVHMHFNRAGQTDETYRLAKRLESWPLEKLSHFIVSATSKEAAVMEFLEERVATYETHFQAIPEVREFRIAQNHALIMALVDALTLVTPITDEMRNQAYTALQQMAIERQQAINADHPYIQEFWEAYEYLNGTRINPVLNHTRDEGFIAINLNHFYEVANRQLQRLPPVAELKRHLKSSRERKFVGQRVISSSIQKEGYGGARSVRCWVFKEKQ